MTLTVTTSFIDSWSAFPLMSLFSRLSTNLQLCTGMYSTLASLTNAFTPFSHCCSIFRHGSPTRLPAFGNAMRARIRRHSPMTKPLQSKKPCPSSLEHYVTPKSSRNARPKTYACTSSHSLCMVCPGSSKVSHRRTSSRMNDHCLRFESRTTTEHGYFKQHP